MTFDNPIDLTLLKDTQHSDWDSKLPTIEYPNGAIRLTRGALASPSPKRISFQEIVQPIGLQKCIFTAYCIDESWLLPHLRKVPRIVFCTHNHEGRRPPRAGRFKRGNLTVIFPPFPSFPNYGVMHSKLMLLFYSTFLRVVISSANLVAYDYEEMVFIQDLPKTSMSHHPTPFMEDLLKNLSKFGITQDLLPDLEMLSFDSSQVKVQLVYSFPGITTIPNSTGLVLLSSIVPKEGVEISLECQGSSLGSINSSWLENFISCCYGIIPKEEEEVVVVHNDGRITSRAHSVGEEEGIKFQPSGENLAIVFPTIKYALKSPLGPDAFGTIFFQEKNWNSPDCPKHLFHQCISTFERGQPIHSKILTAFDKTTGIPLWHYVGSANFTASAWGKFVKENSKLTIANYELGIFITTEQANVLCQGGLPFPYQRPPKLYEMNTNGDNDIPWMQDFVFRNK